MFSGAWNKSGDSGSIDSVRVPKESEQDEHQEVQESVAELVRRSLIQLADMDGVQDRIRRVGERLSRVTPPPERPAQGSWNQDDEAKAS